MKWYYVNVHLKVYYKSNDLTGIFSLCITPTYRTLFGWFCESCNLSGWNRFSYFQEVALDNFRFLVKLVTPTRVPKYPSTGVPFREDPMDNYPIGTRSGK